MGRKKQRLLHAIWCLPTGDLGMVESPVVVNEVLSSLEGMCTEPWKLEELGDLGRCRIHEHNDQDLACSHTGQIIIKHRPPISIQAYSLTWSVCSPRRELMAVTPVGWLEMSGWDTVKSFPPKYWRRACSSEFLSIRACTIFSAAA